MKKIFFLLCLTSLTSSIFSMGADSEDSEKSGKASLASSISSMETDREESGETRIDIANIENAADILTLLSDHHETTKKELEKIKEGQKANGINICITGCVSCLSAMGILLLLGK